MERLAFTHVLLDYGNLTGEQLSKLIAMKPEEQKWRNSFFDSLIGVGLLAELQTLTGEELRQFIFMRKEEQEQWKKKLAEQKTRPVQQHKPESQKQETPWQDEMKTRRLSPKHQQQKAMEVFMDEGIRNGIKALAVTKNMTAQQYVERLLIAEVDREHERVQEGLKFLQQTKGNTTKARFQRLEEKLAHFEGAGSPRRR